MGLNIYRANLQSNQSGACNARQIAIVLQRVTDSGIVEQLNNLTIKPKRSIQLRSWTIEQLNNRTAEQPNKSQQTPKP